jgi:hypothetical protein
MRRFPYRVLSDKGALVRSRPVDSFAPVAMKTPQNNVEHVLVGVDKFFNWAQKGSTRMLRSRDDALLCRKI